MDIFTADDARKHQTPALNTVSMSHLLEVNDLEVKFGLRTGDLTAIDGISFSLDKSERLGLVGESGAGKSVTGFAIINLISKPGFISGGQKSFSMVWT
jgi:peptide/nickel transport system ATP-binding protein